jgi:hypothetical protein
MRLHQTTPHGSRTCFPPLPRMQLGNTILLFPRVLNASFGTRILRHAEHVRSGAKHRSEFTETLQFGSMTVFPCPVHIVDDVRAFPILRERVLSDGPIGVREAPCVSGAIIDPPHRIRRFNISDLVDSAGRRRRPWPEGLFEGQPPFRVPCRPLTTRRASRRVLASATGPSLLCFILAPCFTG